jgi:hypothetical protein
MTDLTVTKANVRPLQGAIIKPFQAGEIVDVGEAVYMKSDGKVWLSDADAAATAQVVGLVVAIGAYGKTESVADEIVDVLLFGPTEGFAGLTPGAQFFASVTPGKIEDTAPAGASADFRWVVGWALSATAIFVNPFSDDVAAQ